ncbi:hypothetical protein TNCV_3265521 [Trichonephila clavipes]|nr:hypothetical protein TNCV_3265521 [Trichonephila clavipes]
MSPRRLAIRNQVPHPLGPLSAERSLEPSPTTHATLPPHTLPRKDPFRCPISIPSRERLRVVLRPLELRARHAAERH